MGAGVSASASSSSAASTFSRSAAPHGRAGAQAIRARYCLPFSGRVGRMRDWAAWHAAYDDPSSALTARLVSGRVGRMRDWAAWHAAYDDPSSALTARLERVRGHLRRAIDLAPAGPVRLVSLCAGQGPAVLGVVPGHPRRHDVSALLVESDERNAAAASHRPAPARPPPARGAPPPPRPAP